AFGQRNGRRSDQRLEHRRCCRPRLRPGFGDKGHAEYGGDGHNGCRGTGSSGGYALLLHDDLAWWVLQTFGRGRSQSTTTNLAATLTFAPRTATKYVPAGNPERSNAILCSTSATK